MLTQEEADQLTKLVEAGKIGTGPWKTGDCQKSYETFKARGVEFVQPSTERLYGIIEAFSRIAAANIMVLSRDKPHQQA